jgi:hypothetical protein
MNNENESMGQAEQAEKPMVSQRIADAHARQSRDNQVTSAFGVDAVNRLAAFRSMSGAGVRPPRGNRPTTGMYFDDVEGASSLAQVSVRSARIVKIGCQEITLIPGKDGAEVRSALGNAFLSKDDLSLLIDELISLRGE